MSNPNRFILQCILSSLIIGSMIGSISYFSLKLYFKYQDDLFIRQEGVFRSQIEEVLNSIKDNTAIDYNINYDDPVLINKRIIMINGDINASMARTVINKMIYLDSLDNNKPINIYISSNGGSLSSVFAIIDIVKSLNTKVNTFVLGNSYSAGTYLLASGTGRRYATKNSIISVHINMFKLSPKSEIDKNYSFDEINDLRIVNFWNGYCKVPGEWLVVGNDKTYYLSPQDAQKYNIIDEVLTYKNETNVPPRAE